MNKFGAVLITSVFCLCACIGFGPHGSRDSEEDGLFSPKDIIGFVHNAINDLNSKINNVDKTRQMIEQVTGPIDTDGDGVISPAEAKAAGAKLAASKDQRAADLLLNPDAWLLLGGSYLGFHGVKNGSMAAVRGAVAKLARHINEQNASEEDDTKPTA